MVDNAIKTAYDAASPVKATLRDTHLQRGGYVFQDSEDPTTIDVGVAIMVSFQGVWFWRDDADTTSVHDGTTVVVDAAGTRFKADYASQPVYSVLDKDLTAPPGGEAIGDSYIVGGSATGDWATHDDDIAIYTGRGYVFATPQAGWEVLAEDETSFYHYTVGGAWALRSDPLAAGSVDVEALEEPAGLVVEAEQNTPPGSPTGGQKYIVGTSPTGSWVGQNGKVAIYRDAAWTYLTPSEGWSAYDKNANVFKTHDGSAWVARSTGSVEQVASWAHSTDVTEIDFTDLGDYDVLHFFFEDVSFDGITAVLQVRVSTDNGSTFDSGASDYSWKSGVASNTGDTADTLIQAFGAIEAVDDTVSGVLTVYNFGTAKKTYISGSLVEFDTSVGDTNIMETMLGFRRLAQSENAIRFFLSTGNFDAGAITVTGIKKVT